MELKRDHKFVLQKYHIKRGIVKNIYWVRIFHQWVTLYSCIEQTTGHPAHLFFLCGAGQVTKKLEYMMGDDVAEGLVTTIRSIWEAHIIKRFLTF